MDPRTRIDHALFQLTPTRTRCDLVVVAGGVSESVASGLLEPFLAHLKTAKDQISKGGYSIVLRPPGAHAPWFTKATLQRFVRFVSTPEVLERLVTIEKEIEQIEGSIQSSENSSVGAEAEDWNSKRSNTISKLKDELNGTNQVECEENSRVRLQRVLDNRKAMLRKEQAMAYARALVAGFDLDSLDDLIYFADTFGASRLREACINFLELCKQKNEDRLWIDEIAAMQAHSHPELPYLRTSGIILAGEANDPGGKQNGLVDASVSESTPSHASLDINQDNGLPTSAQTHLTDGRTLRPVPWPNHLPPYHHFQGPVFQQMPPYPGYLYPGMQVPSSYFPGNVHWPPNMEDSHSVIDQELDDHRNRKESSKKKKHSQAQDNSEEYESTASDNSSYGSDSEKRAKHGKKKLGKKSSRKVVIRNINYITSNGDGEKGSVSEGSLSNNEEYINGDSLKHQVEEALDSLERRHKSTSRHHKKRDRTKLPGKQNGSATGQETRAVTKDNDNWGAFQSLLLREEEPTSGAQKHPLQFEDEYAGNKNFEHEGSSAFQLKSDKVTKAVSNDSFIVAGGKFDCGNQTRIEYYKEGNDGFPIVKKINSTDEEFLFSQRNEESGNYTSVLPSFGTVSSLTKCHKEEDWFIVSQSGKPANEDKNKDFSIFKGDSISSSATGGSHAGNNNKGVVADDSFMIQSRSSENQFSSLSAAQMSLDSDIISTELANSRQESLQNRNEKVNAHEPNDLFMVLDRETAVEQRVGPWTLEMDYENDISSKEQNSKSLNVEADEKQLSNTKGTDTKTSGVRTGKVLSKEIKSKALNGSLGKSRSDITSRSKASPGSRTTTVKSKYEKEEENRKRREELMIQRQKRIAERSSKTGTGNKTSLTSVKNEKPNHPSTEEMKKLHKPVLRNSTIERLAAARVSQKASLPRAKSGTTKKPPSKANGLPPKKTASAEKKKLGPKEVKSLNKKDDKKHQNGVLPSGTNAQTPHDIEGELVLPSKHSATQSVEPNDFNVGLKDITEIPRTSTENNAGHLISERDSMLENSMPNQGRTFGTNLSKVEVLDKISSAPREDKPENAADVIINPKAASLDNAITVSSVDSKVYHESHENSPASTKISGIEISTPPPTGGLMSEPVHSRKKWNSGEDSSKAAKGFRKLLFFGTKS
ncbi:COP1-interacting protein 7 [Prosopis cineraria]|uniref:COP1-interacting protein 7 n=1 Tax=Prosopis cineraria TaxID=364024 RepID=UPI0024107210|nr:COP1-interacting protein 7 [Prosopis cineraria]